MGWPATLAQWSLLLLGGFAVLITALSMTNWSAWVARMWDFPRVQIAVVVLLVTALYAGFFARSPASWTFVALLLAVVGVQIFRIFPYTPIAPKQVKATTDQPDATRTLRVVVTNVLTSNRDYDKWQRSIEPAEPDLIVAAEPDQAWVDEIRKRFGKRLKYEVVEPLDNLYGLAVFCRFPLDAAVEYWVQDDIPSVHGTITLESGDEISLHAVHPRPPIPPEFKSSTPRDAELVLVGRHVAEARERGQRQPTLVVGDLNDVAWSATTRLFLRLSGLLDPRRGRGMYSTFHAGYPPVRFPLDHGFFSEDFRLCEMRRLPHSGSDHFPVLFVLQVDASAEREQDPTKKKAGDDEEADETLKEEAERKVEDGETN